RASSRRSSPCSADTRVARLLRDVGEHAWIGRVVRRLAAAPAARRVAIGPGDDAAVIRPGRGALLLTTDALLEGVHFRAGWASPAMLGRRGLAVRWLRAGRRVPWPMPPLRLRAGRLLAPLAHAMIDVSDGLVQDAGHLCRASGAGAELLAARLPVAAACRRAFGGPAAALFAATAGEDYELLVALPPRAERALPRLRRRLGCRLTRVGRIVAGRPVVRLLDRAGRPLAAPRPGFD